MTETELSAKSASYDISYDNLGDFESYNLLRVEAKRARDLRLELCEALELNPDVTTDETLIGAARAALEESNNG